MIASQQNKGKNYHESYCSPCRSLLPVNAFPNGESTDLDDGGVRQKDSGPREEGTPHEALGWAAAVRG